MGEFADLAISRFERGLSGSYYIPRIYPKISAWQLVNRALFISTIEGSADQHICCEAPGDFAYILRSKVRAIPQRKVKYGDQVSSLSEACKLLGIDGVEVRLSNVTSQLGRLICHDREFADKFLKRNFGMMLSGEVQLLDEVARLVVGTDDQRLAQGSDLLKYFRDAGPLSDDDFSSVRGQLGRWSANQSVLAENACVADWKRAGFELGKAFRSGKEFASCMYRGKLFAICDAEDDQRKPQLFSKMTVCIADDIRDVRPADGVNDAWRVITRWANELAAGSVPSGRNGMRPG